MSDTSDTPKAKRIDWGQPVHCRECGRAMRPKGTPEVPGTVTVPHHSKELCSACYSRAYYERTTGKTRGKLSSIDWSQPVHCLGCQARLRPGLKGTAGYPPGAKRHHGRNRCANCYRLAFNVEPRRAPVIPAEAKERDNRAALDAYMTRRRERLARVARLAAVNQ